MKNLTSTKQFTDNYLDVKAKKGSLIGIPFGQKTSRSIEDNSLIKSETTNKQLNRSILQAGLDVSVRTGNESMSLLFKAAIEGINDVLKEDMGENSIQHAYGTNLDISPEATADRIVSISTSFFYKYQDQNPDMSTEKAAKSFAEIIAGGIDKGFADAREILDGLQVLEGNIASNIDVTYDLVQQGLQDFISHYVDPE